MVALAQRGGLEQTNATRQVRCCLARIKLIVACTVGEREHRSTKCITFPMASDGGH